MASQAVTRPTLTKVTGNIGAEVHGIQLCGDLPQETIDWISDALVENKVLFFRDQTFDREEHVAFGARFGDLEVHPFAKHLGEFNTGNDHPHVIVIKSQPGNRNRGTDMWHSDVTWRTEPSLGSILRCIDIPETGGDTMWADMETAYELLDDEIKAEIENLEATHDWDNFRRGLVNTGVPSDIIDAMNTEFPLATHPVVRTHPVSRRKCLYVNAIFTRGIVGMGKEASDALLAKLNRQTAIPEVQVRLRWEPGTVAFWDNRSTQHYAVADYDANRLMERVTVCGDKPF